MTRKNYIKAAEIVRDMARQDRGAKIKYAGALQQAFARLFAEDSGNFDRDRFRSACQIPDNDP